MGVVGSVLNRMGLVTTRQLRELKLEALGVPLRSGKRPRATVTPETALRNSAVWACLRLRADLVSTFPVDVFRKVEGLDIEMPKSPILVEPGGQRWDYVDWMWASQFDFDRLGNIIGLITERGPLNLPTRIDLVAECSVRQRKGETEPRYKVDGKEYTADQVWHERQYPIAGVPVGLNPVAMAAFMLSEQQSILEFALDWFSGAAVPKARLKHTKQKVTDAEASAVKNRYDAQIANGQLFVHGFEWEYHMIQAQTMGQEWLERQQSGVADVARYFGCPADLIDAIVKSGGHINYSNMTQRNLQFLIMNLGPAVAKREKNLSKLLPRPRFVKLNTDALLRMDPKTRAEVLDLKVKNRTLVPSEARKYDNLPPYTDDQWAELERFAALGRPVKSPATALGYEMVSPYSAVPLDLDYSEVDR